MTRSRHLAAAAGASAITAILLFGDPLTASGTSAARIDHVQSGHGTEQVLFSISGLPSTLRPDLSTVKVMVDGTPVAATATPASQGTGQISRVTVLVIDSSQSMSGARFFAAKTAALAFVAQAPADVKIGLVSFASTVDTVQSPTTDRAAVRTAVSGLQLSRETHLYGGVLAALAAAGTSGQRRIVVLTDGHDTTGSPLSSVTDAVKKSGDQVDLVGLSVSNGDETSLASIASAGGGTLVNAADSKALTGLFSGEAQALAGQVLVTFPVPPSKANTSANLVVRINAGGSSYTDAAFISLGSANPGHTRTPLIPVNPSKGGASMPLLVGGIGATGIAFLLVVAGMLGVFRRQGTAKVEDKLAAYGMHAQPAVPTPTPTTATVKESAVGLTTKAIGRGDFEAKLSWKLDAAGLSVKPAEWVLIHAGLAMGATLVGFLLTSGAALMTVLMLLAGTCLPWAYLGFRASRRVKAFNAQLPESLQLIAGGLTAGLSLPQSLDTIVREGTEPMAGEFRRALVEARLGLGIEDALDGVASRMGSPDFEWVVMAVRIQREVGGNLAELMRTVSSTLREREYLRRQVRALSAEGRLSGWILCLMPPLFLAYLALTNPTGLRPMFHTGIGIGMLTVAALLMAVGSFWMSKVVKVEA
ncbi:MAG: tight adherence protein [Nocardioidaceae bacterium]|jgi:tight adherence protein B|nr:tight adherence protein [Nocardioidaceae bacterium]